MKPIAYTFGAFLILLILLSSIVGTSYAQSELGGRYYGTNEWMWPVPSERNISSGFGPRDSPTAGASSDHKGIDIPCVEGSDIVATKDGKVIKAEYSEAEGFWIAIEHDEHYQSYYMHCSTLFVSVGDTVSRGEVIALSGNTGVSTGPHCHFAILKDGTYVNPLDYVDPTEEITYTTDATTGIRAEMVEYAKQFLGNPYVYGGTSLTNGTDCSGFTMRIYEHFNITIPRTASAQYASAEKITREQLLPGDLLFYKDKNGGIGHVTMYIGNNQVIHASSATTGIIISNISYREPCGYGRYITANYSDEDLKYMAACIAAEALSNSKEGQLAVGYVVMNRVNANGFGNSVKAVVSAKGQFNSPWNTYLNNPPAWAKQSAIEVLEGSGTNPIGSKCYFIATSYAKKLGIENKGINVGDNTFYDKCIW